MNFPKYIKNLFNFLQRLFVRICCWCMLEMDEGTRRRRRSSLSDLVSRKDLQNSIGIKSAKAEVIRNGYHIFQIKDSSKVFRQFIPELLPLETEEIQFLERIHRGVFFQIFLH